MGPIVFLSLDEIIEINKSLGYSVLNKGSLDFLDSKLKSARLTGDERKDVGKGASILWYEIIRNHPFCDGNKRTAAESTLYFAKINSFRLNMPPNGIIYLSLKIANNDISLENLTKEVQGRLEKI
ncbi:MAG: Fic family protein [Candidatus Altiarchaeia archaeon]|jgi:death-on-curing protein